MGKGIKQEMNNKFAMLRKELVDKLDAFICSQSQSQNQNGGTRKDANIIYMENDAPASTIICNNNTNHCIINNHNNNSRPAVKYINNSGNGNNGQIVYVTNGAVDLLSSTNM